MIQKLLKLPASFLFGVSTSAHQSEAYSKEYSESIRDIWEDKRFDRVSRRNATKFWENFEEDIKKAQSLGCKLFRFSIDWSRIEPTAGAFDEKAFDKYQEIITCILSHDMEPVLTLHHFTHPKHIESLGEKGSIFRGLISDEFPQAFESYAEEVAQRFAHLVNYWITFNEPNILIYGYIKPWWEPHYFMPPGLPQQISFSEQASITKKIIQNLFEAHKLARVKIQKYSNIAKVSANPLLVGWPRPIRKLLNSQAKRLTEQNFSKQNRRFTFFDQPFATRANDIIAKILFNIRIFDNFQKFSRTRKTNYLDIDLVIATLTKTDIRADKIDFSESYLEVQLKFLVMADKDITDRHELDNQKVGVIKTSTAEDFLITYKKGTAIGSDHFNSQKKALTSLRDGGIRTFLTDDNIATEIQKENPGKYKTATLNLNDKPGKYSVGVPKGNPSLLSMVNYVVRKWKKDKGVVQKWGSKIPHESSLEQPLINHIESSQIEDNYISFSHREVVDRIQLIRDRGYLKVAVVDSNIQDISSYNPETETWSGLEIDLAKKIANEIFKDQQNIEQKVSFYKINTPNRIPMIRTILEPLMEFWSMLTLAGSDWWHLGMAGELPDFLYPNDSKSEFIDQQDFVGFDYYWGTPLHRILFQFDNLLKAPSSGRFNLAPVWPEGLYHALEFCKKTFPDQFIFIMENGCVKSANEKGKNISRKEYIREHLYQVQKAYHNFINVKGYILWSLTSNHEWGFPFGDGNDFGLYYIDLENDPSLERKSTGDDESYRNFISDLKEP